MYDNQLTNLDSSLFRNLYILEELLLWNNKLTSLDPSLFNNLFSLKELLLDNNQLTSLHPSLLKNLTSLELLRLDNNQLTSLLDLSLFNNLTTNLRYLWLSNNQLTMLDPALFGNISNTFNIEIYIDSNPVALLGKSSAYFCNRNISLCQCFCNYVDYSYVLCSGIILVN